MPSWNFEPVRLPAGIPEFRREIRAFLAEELRDYPTEEKANCWQMRDAALSRKLGARGWIGMVWPKQYGGHERSSIERYVLLEELLVAGAPVGLHWITDRQSGPALLRFGTEALRQKYLPGIARGEIYLCIGMSEPNSGSDLASVRTKAERLADGRWKINGQKIWTSHAHCCHAMIALGRTAPVDEKARHAGLSQFVIDLKSPGVRIRPIHDLAGLHDFNEVFFDDVIVEPDQLLGVEGEGWKQVNSELALERSGPERYLSSYVLFIELLRTANTHASDSVRQLIGSVSAQIWTLRQMSLSVAGQLAAGKDPAVEAAIVKDLGTSFEQQLPALVQAVVDEVSLEDSADFARTLALLLQICPSFSLRGGTREILRGIIARALGLR